MRQRRKSNFKSELSFQKFQPGQRVRISPTGVEFGLFAQSTTGTVKRCGFTVTVQVDNGNFECTCPPDYWEPMEE